MLETVALAVHPSPDLADLFRQDKRTDLVVLDGVFSTSDQSCRFEVRSDGTGEIFYSDFPGDSEEFSHEIEVEKLAAEIEDAISEEIALQSAQSVLDKSEIQSIREEKTTQILEEFFWEQINQTLEDPFFRSFYGEDWGEEFQCEKGTVDEFIEFLELCVLTEREISCPDDYLVVEAETDFDTAGIADWSYFTERLGELVEIACEYYKPAGFHYDYNDGCYDRMSGYSMSSESVTVSLAESARTPAREKMLGMIELRKRLSAMDVTAEKIEKLTAF